MKNLSRYGKLAFENASRLLADSSRSLYFPPLVIFVAIMVATIFGWQSARTALHHDVQTAASERADGVEQSIREQMVAYEQILRGGAGLFQSSQEVTMEEWESFLMSIGLDKHFQGIQGMGFVKVFNANELPAVRAFMAKQDIKDFTIEPVGTNRDQYAAVVYIHSVSSSQNLQRGFDMYSEPVRRAAMLKARDSGEIIMTPRLALLPANAGEQRIGFSMFAPYYDRHMPTATEKDRQTALKGYVYASFRADTFFKNIIGEPSNPKEAYYIAATTDGATRTMYQSPTYPQLSGRSGHVDITRDVRLYGQEWMIRFVSSPGSLVSSEQLARPNIILFFGLFAAVLIAFIITLLIRARARDLSTQKEQAVELAKDELLSLASHQLRTPATGVKQYVGMVLQGFAGKITVSQKKLLEKAYASNDRQLRIINEILHLAKIGSGRIVLAKKLTNLNDLVADVVNEQRADIESAEHGISIELPKKPLLVHADTHMLRMAIENILSNAIKYTRRKGSIQIRTYQQADKTMVEIEDNGIGIKPEDLDKIFRQFSRLPNEMSQQVGGTGIGLYLAKHLVELHGGSIKVVSQPDVGSTFAIVLPAGNTTHSMKNLTVG